MSTNAAKIISPHALSNDTDLPFAHRPIVHPSSTLRRDIIIVNHVQHKMESGPLLTPTHPIWNTHTQEESRLTFNLQSKLL